ncbi:MAG TPA: DNA repair protein RecO [Acidobacteriaceae bacterium]|nr:DNA repair protein RecO [Acidobacteriaceae bacterium]
MAKERLILHHGEAIVLRTWPFGEADLLVSLLTREQGVIKGVARHAMRSRRRFGGALEPGTYVTAQYAERPREDLVRLDSFEILWSPLRAPIDWRRMAGLQLVVEVLEQALPEQAPEDNVFRLALTVLQAMEPFEQGVPGEIQAAEGEPAWLAVTYFCVWMCRLMGWWPELGHCAVCGLDLRGGAVWWSPVADGVTCADDRRPGSRGLPARSVAESSRIARESLPQMLREDSWPRDRASDLREFATALLERHLEKRIRSAAALP